MWVVSVNGWRKTQNPAGRTALLKAQTNKNQQQQQPIKGQLLLCASLAA